MAMKVIFNLQLISQTYEIDLSEYDALPLEIWESWSYEKKIKFLERDVSLKYDLRDLIHITEQKMTSENYRQLLNNEFEDKEMTKEDFDNTLMHFAMLYHTELLRKHYVVERSEQLPNTKLH